MTTHAAAEGQGRVFPAKTGPDWREWAKIGLAAAAAASLGVVIVQAIALALWPDIALFKPLDSYARSILFVVVPAFGATAVWAWLVSHTDRPNVKFISLSAVVLLISFIPDYALPVSHKTLLASSVAAFMHVVAAGLMVAVLVAGYYHRSGQCRHAAGRR
jgi:hypothetical protein